MLRWQYEMEVFEYQARLSVELGKPLVIHLVKAMSELLKLKQQIKPANYHLDYSWFSRESGSGGGVPEAWVNSFFSGRNIRKRRCGLLLPTACFWRLTRAPCWLRIYIAGQPKSVAYLWQNSRKLYGKISPKSFLNNKSCLFG